MDDAEQVHRGVRLLLAGGILLGGIAAGSLFRRPTPASPVPADERTDQAMYQQPSALPARDPRVSAVPATRVDVLMTAPARLEGPSGAAGRGAATLPADSPPALPRSYPWSDTPDLARPGVTAAIGGVLSDASRAHRISDGDTLARLAERYLGDPARAVEIYEANRAVLPSPDSLPIGEVVRIPPKRPAGS